MPVSLPGSILVRARLDPETLKYFGGHPGEPREVGYGTLGYRAVPVPGRTAVLGTGFHTVFRDR